MAIVLLIDEIQPYGQELTVTLTITDEGLTISSGEDVIVVGSWQLIVTQLLLRY